MRKITKARSAKNKGLFLQKWVARQICELFRIKFDNQDDNSMVQSRQMGQSGTDVILRGEVYEKFPFDIECKNTESVSLYKFIEQAKSNTKDNRDWLLFHKKNFLDPIVVMDAQAFFRLYEKIINKN